MPNNVVLRLGPSSQVQLATAKPALAEFVETAGVARFSNQNSTAPVNVTTPYGVIEASPGATFDVYVGDQSMEVLALAGSVNFIHAKDRTPYRIVPGATSLIANAVEVGPGSGTVDPAWAAWNQGLDRLWAQRAAAASASVQYLPKPLRRDAYELDKNGRWERVLYKGREVMLWRPTDVPKVGRRLDRRLGVEWIATPPGCRPSFGYVTNHSGTGLTSMTPGIGSPPAPRDRNRAGIRAAWPGSGPARKWAGCPWRRRNRTTPTGSGALRPWLWPRARLWWRRPSPLPPSATPTALLLCPSGIFMVWTATPATATGEWIGTGWSITSGQRLSSTIPWSTSPRRTSTAIPSRRTQLRRPSPWRPSRRSHRRWGKSPVAVPQVCRPRRVGSNSRRSPFPRSRPRWFRSLPGQARCLTSPRRRRVAAHSRCPAPKARMRAKAGAPA
jgi:hypothetical protein